MRAEKLLKDIYKVEFQDGGKASFFVALIAQIISAVRREK